MNWDEVHSAVAALAARNDDARRVYGVPTGGAVVAALLTGHKMDTVDAPEQADLVVDDLVDSGRTLSRYAAHRVDALFRKPHSPAGLAPRAEVREGWLRFPWERDGGDPTDAVVRLLQHIGEDPEREGLRETPQRVVKAISEMTAGYRQDPAALMKTFEDGATDQMVVVTGCPVASLCEHHGLPFAGVAHVGYLPHGRVIGLSKIPRLVDAFARRLQTQERLTQQIAHALQDHLRPTGVGVVVVATHSCMALRGVRSAGTSMVTSCLLGAIRDGARQEFLRLVGY